MKTSLLELLQCPVCGRPGPFSTRDEICDGIEMVRGEVVCTVCSGVFPVQDGYCHLMPRPSEAVLQEQAAQQRIEARDASPAAPPGPNNPLLRLPEGDPEAEEHAPQVNYAVSRLGVGPGTIVLDLGGGLGWTSAMFARAGARCVMLDIYSSVLRASRCFVENGDYFERILADMSNLPLRPESFDVVFSNAALHHTPDLTATLREAGRVLKPGGHVMFVNEPVIGRWERRRLQEFGADYREDGIRERAYRTTEWRDAFEQAGLAARFYIPDAGLLEKIERRRQLGVYQKFPKKQALSLLGNAALRSLALRLISPLAMHLYPFNVVLEGTKRR